MPQRSYRFHAVTRLRAAAVGEPGQRTFYLLVGEGPITVRVWMEKEQLAGLGLAIRQVIESLDEEGRRLARETGSVRGDLAAPDEHFAEDFRTGRLALGIDRNRRRLAVMAYDLPEELNPSSTGGEEPLVQGWASLAAMRELSEEIATVVAAGRPVCPLCGRPIDPEGHRCPRSNGHRVGSLSDLDTTG